MRGPSCDCGNGVWHGDVEWAQDATLRVNVECGGAHRWPGCTSSANTEAMRKWFLRRWLRDLLDLDRSDPELS